MEIFKEIEPNLILGQHFLIDEKIINQLISFAELKKADIILEIGPGTGNITKKLAEKVKKVIAVEIDSSMKNFLHSIPKNVELIFEDAIKYLKKNPPFFNKIISNLPYSLCEAIINYLCFNNIFDLAILILPQNFAENLKNHIIFSSFLKTEILQNIPRTAFYPEPKTDSVITKITPRPSYKFDKDEKAFICRKLYLQWDKKLKNGLREALIDFYKLKKDQIITKKQAKAKIENMGFPQELIEKEIEHLSLEEYQLIISKCQDQI